MSGDQDDSRGGPVDHRFVSTQQIRLREKNPQIERKATLRQDSQTIAQAVEPPFAGPPPLADSSPEATNLDRPGGRRPPPSGESLYDRIERTDELVDVDEVRAQLEAALQPDAPDGPDASVRSVPHPRSDTMPARPPPERTETVPAPRPPAPRTAPPRSMPKRAETLPTRPARFEPMPSRPPPSPRTETIPVRPRPAPSTLDDQRAPTAPREPQNSDRGRAPEPVRVAAAPLLLDDEETVVADATARLAPPQPSVQPRARLVGGGTKGAAAELRRQNILRNADFPDLRAAPLKVYVGALEDHRLHRLDAVLAGDHDETGIDDMSAKRSLEHLLFDRAFADLPFDDRCTFLRTIADSDEDLTTLKAVLAVSKIGLPGRLDVENRAAMHEVFGRLDAEGRARFARAAARRVGRRSALEDHDDTGQTVLIHLRSMLDGQQVDPWWSTHGLLIVPVCSLITSVIAMPVRLASDEGSEGVASAVEFALADAHPAVLTRLWRQVLTASRDVRLGGGTTIDIEAVRKRGPAQTPLRALLFALAERLSGSSERGFLMAGTGIDAPVLAGALSALFGITYRVSAGAPSALRELHRAAERPGPPSFITLLHDAGEQLFVFDHLDESHVYFRAPHGRSARRAGEIRAQPTREVVDPSRGIERVSRASFEAAAGAAFVPPLQVDASPD